MARKKKELDPTQTESISNAWEKDFNRRYRQLKGEVNTYIDSLQRDGTTYRTVSGYVFGRDFQATVEFMNFFNQEVDRIIRGLINSVDDTYLNTDNWMKIYIDPSYLKGIKDARIELRKQGVPLEVIPEDITPVIPITGATDAFVPASPLSRPIHLSAVQAIYQRDYDWLKDDSRLMSSQVRNVLATGIQEGQGITEISKNIRERIDVGASRSRRIARTETAHSYQLGTINEGEILSEQLGEELRMEWVATLDSRVRPDHLARHGKAYLFEEARRKINESPWNCRCALVPLTMSEVNSPERRAEVREEKQEVQREIDVRQAQ